MGLLAEEVKSNVVLFQTTMKLENAGTVLSYVKDPDVGNGDYNQSEFEPTAFKKTSAHTWPCRRGH